jgi:sugar porter (SP) family MFS transporter
MDAVYNARYVLFISFISALGGYLFGFDFAVISSALPFLREQFGLDAYWEGFATACLAIGAIGGCIFAGRISERFGRRRGLLCAAVVFALSSLGMAFSPSLSSFIFFRFAAGFGVGMASMLSPIYIAEISPPKIRGRMVAVNQLAIVTGILVTNLVNYSFRDLGDDAWRWMFGVGVLPSLLFLLGILVLPESPGWLVAKERHADAEAALSKIGNGRYVSETMSGIKKALPHRKAGNFSLLFSRVYLPVMTIGVVLAMFQQLCGINVVFNYTSNIFESIGASKDDQLLQTVFIGGVNLVFTLFAMVLVDRVGRRPLMLAGSGGLCILYMIIAYFLAIKSALVSVFLLLAIGLFATTLAPVTWVLISEIFPSGIRLAASSFAVLCLWLAYFITIFTFPLLQKAIGTDHTFYIYSAVCLLGFVFIRATVKETNGRSLDEMDTLYSGHG